MGKSCIASLVFLFLFNKGYGHGTDDGNDDFNILNYGAIENDFSNNACYINSAAIEQACIAANQSIGGRTVLIPSNKEFCIFSSEVHQLHNVTFQVEGKLTISNNITEWLNNIVTYTAALNFIECKDFTMNGNGVLNGQGYDWWWATTLKGINRPHLFFCSESENVLIQDVLFMNSPKFHCRVYDVHQLHIHNIEIYVDIYGQAEILKKKNKWHYYSDHEKTMIHYNNNILLNNNTESTDTKTEIENNKYLINDGIPIFPLNTDGIDVSGYDMLIENIKITNFDDAIVIKPSSQTSYWDSCSHNIHVRNINVTYSVGMSIGSISPSMDIECISDVIFENVNMLYPFKAVYVKTNPGNDGTGIVNNITYKDFVIDGSLWYPIWIGPQQETTGPGEASCSFLYPIIDECPTQPLVTISNILLENMVLTRGLFLPGIILGNETNPISNLTMKSIQNSGKFVIGEEYICEGTDAHVSDCSPIPDCAEQ
jgi:polygalacturonase